MLELIFASAFILIMRIYAEASFFITEKVKNLANISGKLPNYIAAFVLSGIVSYGSKMLGVGAIYTLLVSLGFTGGVPDVPAEALNTWVYFILIHIGSFLVAGGIYDWRQQLSERMRL